MLKMFHWDREDISIVSPSPVASLLMKAADIIEKRGHAKYRRYDFDGNGGYCFLGALGKAEGDVNCNTDLMREACKLVAKSVSTIPELEFTWDYGTGDEAAAILIATVNWNNEPDRTKEEVVNAMRAAAKVAQYEPQGS